MFSQIVKFIQILSSETAPIQISAGLALAMIAGFTPLFSLHNLLVLFALLFLRLNIAAFLLGLALFTGFAYLLDPLFHNLGVGILGSSEMMSVWTEMYNSSFWRLTQFNNTIVMGSLVFSLLAFIPVLFIANFLINHYRNDVLKYVNNSRLFVYFKSSKLITRFIALSE